jgi:putative transcriptional regulator
LSFARGKPGEAVVHIPHTVDVKAVRLSMNLTQERFAVRFGFSVDAIRNWEQGRRLPDVAARAYLRVIEREPEAVLRALGD